MSIENFIRELNKDWTKLVYKNQHVNYIEIKSGFRFWNQPRRTTPYFDVECEELTKRLNDVVRIEISHNGDYYPVWTKEDGIIELNQMFVRLNGRYYTIPFLEDLINKVQDFKTINI